jgi:beta-glucosidase
MTFYGQVNGVKPVRYKDLIDVLKKPKEEGGMGFQGFVVSDWQDIGTSGSAYKNNIATSINAGVDMAMLCNSRANWLDFISHLKDLVNEGTVTMERIDDAVYRILLFKKVFGILDDPIVPSAGTIGTPEDRQVARDIAAKALVLLKNTDNIVGKLSGNTYTNILIAGEGSAHLGIQCGGWTREWQGQTTATITDFTGTNIETGIRNALQEAGKNVQRTADGHAPAGFTPDVVIAVVSEVSYAEGTGDASDPAIGTNATNVSKGVTSDTAMLANVYGHNVPVVLIVMAGRPIKLKTTTGGVTTNQAEKCDGIVAVWLPGSEGGDAIADVLFGDKDFVGKTPFTWRVTPYTPTDPGEVVFPYGWGLKKGETATPTL